MLKEKEILQRRYKNMNKNRNINKALLESVAQITEMTKSDHPAAATRVKSTDKMVMLPPLFDSTKPEVAKHIMRGSINISNFKLKVVILEIQLVKQ